MKHLFGGLIAVVLLGMYLHLMQIAIKVALCVSTAGCTTYPEGYFNPGMAQALSMIGGLVSALVIAVLAVTPSGQAPMARALAPDVSPWVLQTVKIVSAFYVLAWIGAGFAAFYISLYHPKALPELTTLGQNWLGLAVSAAYAYFGLKPTG